MIFKLECETDDTVFTARSDTLRNVTQSILDQLIDHVDEKLSPILGKPIRKSSQGYGWIQYKNDIVVIVEINPFGYRIVYRRAFIYVEDYVKRREYDVDTGDLYNLQTHARRMVEQITEWEEREKISADDRDTEHPR